MYSGMDTPAMVLKDSLSLMEWETPKIWLVTGNFHKRHEWPWANGEVQSLGIYRRNVRRAEIGSLKILHFMVHFQYCNPEYIYIYISGWWFGTCLYFSYIGNNHPNWLSYFSEGLKPPTRCIYINIYIDVSLTYLWFLCLIKIEHW